MFSLEYIAGFFDGEGSVGVYTYGRNKPYALRTQIAQNKNELSTKLFLYLKSRFGGNITEQKTLSGNIKYNWQLNAEKACEFLKIIEPFMHIKKEQAKIAIKWQTEKPKVFRDEKGRLRCDRNVSEDSRVANKLKELKSA